MASESKIKVKTPLVELDGDEVWVSFYSSILSNRGFTSLRLPRVRLAHFRSPKRGEIRGILRKFMCQPENEAAERTIGLVVNMC
jgi:hypothetical protein